MYGLDETVINDLKQVFSRFSAVEKVILFGSRAMGKYWNQTIFDMRDEKEELYLPYSFDISIFDRIDHSECVLR
ncbi:MAG TPA: hypothetical protein PLD70_13250 [Thermotogota bacterium]|nr:hypothetical protein [Thermotogota bacterium]